MTPAFVFLNRKMRYSINDTTASPTSAPPKSMSTSRTSLDLSLKLWINSSVKAITKGNSIAVDIRYRPCISATHHISPPEHTPSTANSNPCASFRISPWNVSYVILLNGSRIGLIISTNPVLILLEASLSFKELLKMKPTTITARIRYTRSFIWALRSMDFTLSKITDTSFYYRQVGICSIL